MLYKTTTKHGEDVVSCIVHCRRGTIELATDEDQVRFFYVSGASDRRDVEMTIRERDFWKPMMTAQKTNSVPEEALQWGCTAGDGVHGVVANDWMWKRMTPR